MYGDAHTSVNGTKRQRHCIASSGGYFSPYRLLATPFKPASPTDRCAHDQFSCIFSQQSLIVAVERIIGNISDRTAAVGAWQQMLEVHGGWPSTG